MNSQIFAFLTLFSLVAAPARSEPAHTPAQAPLSGQHQGKDAPRQADAGNDLAEFRDEAEEGIKHVLITQVEAWNHGNLPGYMSGYWHSPELVFFSGGTVTKGWEPTLERYQQRYGAPGKEMGKLEFSELHIDPLSRRAAVVTGQWELTMSDGKKPHGLFTLILKKLPAGWKIVHDHTSGA
jgi:ketosteroid isomerase-like protein